ncbi:MAG: sigma-70 family RNA polymerase sigma factor [Cetobacterium sp.]
MSDFEIFKEDLKNRLKEEEFDAVSMYIEKKANIPKIRNCIIKLIGIDNSLSVDDILQEIRMIVWRNENKDSNYILTTQHIYRAVLEFGERYNKKKRVGYDKVSYTDDITSCSVNSIQVDPNTKIFIESLLATLHEDDSYLVKLYFYEGYSVRDIAKKINTHTTTVQRRLEKIIKELRLQID